VQISRLGTRFLREGTKALRHDVDMGRRFADGKPIGRLILAILDFGDFIPDLNRNFRRCFNR